MKKIILNRDSHEGLTMMIFAEGTILKPRSWVSLYRHDAYVPIGNGVEMVNSWDRQGANIIYCTSRKKRQADDIAALLKKYGFAGAFLAVREGKESYKDIVEALRPHILIEDDCRSIGGAWQMCISKVEPEIKSKIISVVVPEFKGIGHLPEDIRLF